MQSANITFPLPLPHTHAPGLRQRADFAKAGLLSMLTALLLVSSGCQEKRYPSIEYPTWPELQLMQSTDVMMPIDTSYAQGDMAGFKAAIQAPEFATALDQFEASEIPSGFGEEVRQKSKDEAVAQFRKCIELAKSDGSQDEIKAAYDAATAALRAVSAPRE